MVDKNSKKVAKKPKISETEKLHAAATILSGFAAGGGHITMFADCFEQVMEILDKRYGK